MARKINRALCLMLLLSAVLCNVTNAQVIKWSTYLNTSADDQLVQMIKDNSGDIYILGVVKRNGFPVTPGAYQSGLGTAVQKATVTKLSGATGNLIWSTYLGGDYDYVNARGIYWDTATNTINVTASSSSNNYPVVGGGNPKVVGAKASIVLTQFNAITGAVTFSTHVFLSITPAFGTAWNGIAYTQVNASYQMQINNGNAYFLSMDTLAKKILVSKINLATRQFVYQKSIKVTNGVFLPDYFGGGGYFNPSFLGFVVHNDEVYVSGSTNATDLQTTPGAYQTTYPTGANIAYFITKLTGLGNIAFGTYANYDPSNYGYPYFWASLAVYNNEVTFYVPCPDGLTVSPGGIAYDNIEATNNGLLKLNTTDGSLKFFSYLGPANTFFFPTHRILYSGGDLFIFGKSSSAYLPTTVNAIQPYAAYHNPDGYDGSDAYFMHINSQNLLVYCTYLGGEGTESFGTMYNNGNKVYLQMATNSNSFPITGNATQPINKGSNGSLPEVGGAGYTGEFVLMAYDKVAKKFTYSSFLGSNVNDYSYNYSNNSTGDDVFLSLTAWHYLSLPLTNDLPISPDAFQKTMIGQGSIIPGNQYATSYHQYVAKINTASGKLQYGSYIGSLPISKGELGNHIITDGNDIFLGGYSYSKDYPVTQGAVRTTFMDTSNASVYTSDIFVTKLSLCYSDVINDSILPKNITVCRNSIIPKITGTVPNFGNVPTILRDNIPQSTTWATNFTYQWQQSDDSTTWNNIDGATLKDYQPQPISAKKYLRRIAASSSCENRDTSNVAVISLSGIEATRPNVGGNEGSFFACPSGNLNIGTPATAGFTYTWQPSLGLSSTSSAQTVFNLSTPGAYTYELIATDNNGCTSKDTAVIYNYKADAGPDKVLCAGKPIRIGGLPLAGLSGITYTWQPSVGLSCSNCAQPTAISTGTYILTVNVPLPQGGNCITKDTVTVGNTNIPLHPAGNDTTICNGQSAVVGTPRVNGFTYNWTPGNFLDDISDSAMPTFNKLNANLELLYNPVFYILTASNPAGCVVIDTVFVYVNDPFATDRSPVCRPYQLGRRDRTRGQATYQWVMVDANNVEQPIPANEISATNIANPFALYDPAITENRVYRVKETWNGVTCTQDVTVGVVCDCPKIDIKFKSNSGCPNVTNGDSITLFVDKPSPLFTYKWSPSTGLNTTVGPVVKTGVTTSTVYTVTATSIYDANFICQASIKVNFFNISAPEFNVHDTLICKGRITNIGLPEVAGLKYEWTTSVSNGNVVDTTSNPAVTGDKDIIYYVLVTDPVSGCITKDTVNITTPQIPVEAGISRYACSNGGFKIGSPGVAGYTYFWIPATGLNDNSIAQPTVLFNTQTIGYTLIVTDPVTGCSATDIVAILHSDTPFIDNIVPPAPYCEGSNTSVQIGNPQLDSVRYTWSPAIGLSDVHAAQPFANPNVTTTYTLTAEFPGGCSTTANTSVTVTVIPKPTAVINPVSNCINTQLNTTTNAGLPSYYWTPATALDNQNAANPISTTSVPITYLVTIIDSNRCSNTASYTVIPPVVANAGVDKEVCKGGTVQIGAAAETGVIYSWTPNTGLSSYNTSQTSTLNTLNEGVYTYYVSATANGCTKSDSVKVKINAIPTVAQLSGAVICNGGSVQVGVANETGVVYSWSPALGLSNSNISNPIASPTQTTVYTLTATNLLTGCSSSSSTTITVNTTGAPTVTATANRDIICPSNPVQLNANVTGAGNYSYAWTPPVSFLSSQFISNPTVAPITTTTYSVLVTNTNNGCATTAQTTIEVRDTCNPLPVTWLTFTAVLHNGKTLLNWKVAMEHNNKEFIVERSTDGIRWNRLFTTTSLGNISIPRGYSGIDQLPVQGVNFYRVKQVDIDGKENISIIRSVVVGKTAPEFVVYPNPTNSILNYNLVGASTTTKLNLQLYTAEGRLVKTIYTLTVNGYFSVIDLPAGMYVLRMVDENGSVANKKVVINK